MSMPATVRISSSGYSSVGAIHENMPLGSARGLCFTSGSYLQVGVLLVGVAVLCWCCV